MSTQGITGINHVTFGVVDLERAVAFYRDVLGGRLAARWDGGAYVRLGSLWVALLLDPEPAGPEAVDRSHLALDVSAEDYPAVEARIVAAGAPLWRDNETKGESLYFTDPDGHRLELHVGSLASRLADLRRAAWPGLEISEE